MSDPLEGLPAGTAYGLLRFAVHGDVAYLLWGVLRDVELEDARAAMADLAVDEDLRHEAAMRRSEKLRAIGSEATFFSGLARIDGELRSVRVAVTAQEFVLLDNWTHLDPDTELARFPRESITEVVIVDENGRHDASDQLPQASFLFRSGEPALECRDRYRRFIGPHG